MILFEAVSRSICRRCIPLRDMRPCEPHEDKKGKLPWSFMFNAYNADKAFDQAPIIALLEKSSGPERTRTACLRFAKAALYQMSYGPNVPGDTYQNSYGPVTPETVTWIE